MARPFSAVSLLTLLLTSSASAQIIVNPAPEVHLTNRDTRAVTVPAGSTVSLSLVADPIAAGGDVFDIVTTDPAVVISLILPTGIEVNAGNADALGESWTVLPDGSFDQSLIPSTLSSPGTHTVIRLGSSSPSGTYQVRANASASSLETLLIASYFSSSAVRVGVVTESPLYRIGDKVLVTGLVFDGSSPVASASPVAGIGVPSDPAMPPEQVTLQDSGTFDVRTGDGIYTGEFTATSAGSFSVGLRATGLSNAGIPFSRTATTSFRVLPPLAVFAFLADEGVDDDSNQLIDHVVVTALADVQRAGQYQFGVTLKAENGAEVKASSIAALDTGSASISASFAADDIRRLGSDGPYALNDAILTYRDDPETPAVDFRKDAGNTRTYTRSSLETSPLSEAGLNSAPVIGPVSDLAVDATSAEGAVVSFDLPTVTDSVDLAPSVSAQPASGSVFPPGTTTVTMTATNASGNSSSATFTVTVRSMTPPTITVPANIVLEATGSNGVVGTFAVTASDVVDGPLPVTCDRASGSTFPLFPLGTTTTVTCRSTNGAGTTATKTFTVAVRDMTPPTINCGAPDGAWHASDVSIGCTAQDVASGLMDTADASFTLTTAIAANNETVNASTNARTVCDNAGNCATAGPIGGNRVDKKGPQINLVAPANLVYTVNQVVAANYGCADAGASVTACLGEVPNGSSIDTASVSTHTFVVNSTDAVGNSSTASLTYQVSYGGVFTNISPISVWLGLKNSDDVGTRFDLLAEILKNGAVVAVGQVDNVAGGSSGFNNAALKAINVALGASVTYLPGDTAGVRVSVRVAPTGHRSGTARLWFNDSAANSLASTTVNGVARTFYLVNGFGLALAPGSGPKSYIDVFVDRAVRGNPFKPFGTWTFAFWKGRLASGPRPARGIRERRSVNGRRP